MASIIDARFQGKQRRDRRFFCSLRRRAMPSGEQTSAKPPGHVPRITAQNVLVL